MICMISHSVETPRGTGAFFFNTLRLRRPIKAGIFPELLFPSQPLRPSDTSPIFCCAKHRGGGDT